MTDEPRDAVLEKELQDVLQVTKNRLPLLVADLKLVELREVVEYLRDQAERVRGQHSVTSKDRVRTMQSPVSRKLKFDVLEAKIRAERAFAVAVRKGQAMGVISSRKMGGANRDGGFISPKSLFTSQGEMTDLYQLADFGDDADFEAALHDARHIDDSMSRRNVTNRLRQRVEGNTVVKTPRQIKADTIKELADQGLSSRQIADEVGLTYHSVRLYAREFGFAIPADNTMKRAKGIDSNKIVSETIDTLAALGMGLELIEYDDLDQDQVEKWTETMDEAFKVLIRFRKNIKELRDDD